MTEEKLLIQEQYNFKKLDLHKLVKSSLILLTRLAICKLGL